MRSQSTEVLREVRLPEHTDLNPSQQPPNKWRRFTSCSPPNPPENAEPLSLLTILVPRTVHNPVNRGGESVRLPRGWCAQPQKFGLAALLLGASPLAQSIGALPWPLSPWRISFADRGFLGHLGSDESHISHGTMPGKRSGPTSAKSAHRSRYLRQRAARQREAPPRSAASPPVDTAARLPYLGFTAAGQPAPRCNFFFTHAPCFLHPDPLPLWLPLLSLRPGRGEWMSEARR